MLFISNSYKLLADGAVQVNNKDEILDLIWQEMHALMSKLTSTKRKVT